MLRRMPLRATALTLLLATCVTACHEDSGTAVATPDAGADAIDDAAQEGDADVGPDLVEDTSDDGGDEPDVLCAPEPTDRALLQAGADDDGVVLAPGGRGLETPGITTEVLGFPANVVISADGAFAYVISTSNDDRRVLVLSMSDGLVAQDVSLDDAFYGIALDDARGRLYVSGGITQRVEVFDVDADAGTLTPTAQVAMPAFVSGLALADDGARLLVGSFTTARIFEIDTAALDAVDPVVATWQTAYPVWDIAWVPSSDRVIATTLEGNAVQLIDRATAQVRPSLELGRSPMGIAVSPDGTVAWFAVSGLDEVVSVDLATGAVLARAPVTDDAHVDADGEALPRSNANDVLLSADGTRLYVTRGADNAVTVLDAADLSIVGAFPTAWYPTGLALSPDGGTLVVTEGKGFGSGPNEGQGAKNALDGTVSFVPLDSLDLAATTAAARANFNRPNEVFPFACEGFFPIPSSPGQPTPIEHVILVVKENKTFDCVFGDLEDMDVDVDPTLVRWGEEFTPNAHALARAFSISDNFYDEVETSDAGHLMLTAGTLTDFVERMWIEAARSGALEGFQVDDAATPESGNLFTHLIDHGIDIRIYGEIVGMFAEAADGTEPLAFSDGRYPGGIFYTLGARDTDRAQYVVDRINEGDFAQFTFMLMPNDHTGGITPGNPTPEAQVADNDYGLGILVDGVSRSQYWDSTVIIVVEDDPQGCEDHVDAHRSFALVISPWARRGHVSHVNASFQSVFATITRILDVPPMGRPDDAAAPLWDMFSATPDFTPFDVVARNVPEEKILDINTPGARESMRMDFRGPDRNEDLGVVLDAYRLWRMGRIDASEAQRRIDHGTRSLPAGVVLDEEEIDELEEEREEEAREEAWAFDHAWRQYEAWLTARGEPIPQLLGGPLDEATIDAVMSGAMPVEELRRFQVR